MTFAVNWKKIIIIRYSYPTGSMKITTKDIATVPFGTSVNTFFLIRYIKRTFGYNIVKSILFLLFCLYVNYNELLGIILGSQCCFL